MSFPIVYARAPIVAAVRSAFPPVCVRTSPKSSPNLDSMNACVAGSRGAPCPWPAAVVVATDVARWRCAGASGAPDIAWSAARCASASALECDARRKYCGTPAERSRSGRFVVCAGPRESLSSDLLTCAKVTRSIVHLPVSDALGEPLVSAGRTCETCTLEFNDCRGPTPMETAMLTTEQLQAIMPALPAAKRATLFPSLTSAIAEFGIEAPARTAAFLAQLAHESAQFRFMEEIWGPTAAQRRYEPQSQLATNLGNTETGDGFRFKGRGPIQITGRANYRRFGDILGVDLVADPDRAAQPDLAFRIAGAFWSRKVSTSSPTAPPMRRFARLPGGSMAASMAWRNGSGSTKPRAECSGSRRRHERGEPRRRKERRRSRSSNEGSRRSAARRGAPPPDPARRSACARRRRRRLWPGSERPQAREEEGRPQDCRAQRRSQDCRPAQPDAPASHASGRQAARAGRSVELSTTGDRGRRASEESVRAAAA